MESKETKLPIGQLPTDAFSDAAWKAATEGILAQGVKDERSFVIGALWARLHLKAEQRTEQSEDQPFREALASVLYEWLRSDGGADTFCGDDVIELLDELKSLLNGTHPYVATKPSEQANGSLTEEVEDAIADFLNGHPDCDTGCFESIRTVLRNHAQGTKATGL